ncbi:MAG: hypothetical protein AD742_01080 [Methylibium sp. NZG]|nr:MAG: hypothetical protein AD742_01080 [Methylibium sp. NZG]
MTHTAALHRFCFAHACAFVVPAEALGEHGADKTWADAALAQRRVTPAQLRCLEDGFALYWQRASALFARAPGSWFPPRPANLLIVSQPGAVAPYFDPFGGSSSLLYLSDLDTAPEYVAWLLMHNERVALLRSVRAALICNLSAWLGDDATNVAARQAFAAAARRARRPDAAMFVQLADAFDWITDLRHATLRPPDEQSPQTWLHIDAAELYVPQHHQARLTALCDAADAALERALKAARPPRAVTTRATLERLCNALRRKQAHLIVKALDGRTVWLPGADDVRALRDALGGASDAAVASLHADFLVVHERSRQFLDALTDPASLPRHCGVLEASDSVYLDAAQHAVVYELQQGGFDAGTDPAPPWHRMLLGARVMHEWGHLAHAAKLLRVPEPQRAAYAAARVELGEQFLRVLQRLPGGLQAEVAEALSRWSGQPAEQAAALARKTLARVGDYLANLMCSHFLPAEEMQTYVRCNVRSHLGEGLVDELARYAYEVHYLGLAAMPRDYFFGVSRYTDCFVRTGLVSQADTNALFDAAGRVLACYTIDESRLRLPATRAAA